MNKHIVIGFKSEIEKLAGLASLALKPLAYLAKHQKVNTLFAGMSVKGSMNKALESMPKQTYIPGT